jgi:diguanylate cyclase (GGDEF)-like protein
MPDGSVARIIGTDTDISKLKAAEDLLKQALANMADALVMYDRDDRLVMCNEQYRRMFPKTAHLRVPGAHFRDILRASLETGEEVGVARGEVATWIDKTCASLHVTGDGYIHLGDGRWLHSRVRPTLDGGSLSVISDVTKSRLAEQKLAELNRRLEELARLDGLTGLTNRRAFDETLQNELRRSVRTKSPLSLFLVDVDRFKAFNDAYGHPAGDDCLKSIAGLLGKTLRRPADTAARYGGEEFVAILPDTSLEGAFELAETLRGAVANLNLEHIGSEKGIVTVSIGISTFDGAGGLASSAADLVKTADDALYEAKAAGRDKVCHAKPHRLLS